jgi:hypothetical protein
VTDRDLKPDNVMCGLCNLHPTSGLGCILCAARRIAPGADEAIEQIEQAYLRACVEAAGDLLHDVLEGYE